MRKTTALFDLDGVIIDTEPQYDKYWLETGHKYGLPDDFPQRIKGTTMASILDRYFGQYTKEEQRAIEQDCIDYEADMPIYPVEGTLEFMKSLKEAGVKMGLVTSSGEAKVKRVISLLGLDELLTTIVTPARILRGKPDPMCYQLGAKDLGAEPEECIVFEDALTGIAAGKGAGIKVVALSTTFPKEKLEEVADIVVPNLKGFTADDFFGW